METFPNAIQAMRYVRDHYGFPEDRAERIIDIALRHRLNREPISGGYLEVTSHRNNAAFQITDTRGEKPTRRVASAPKADYTQGSKSQTVKPRRNSMPARTRTKPAETVEPEVEEEDFSEFLTKAYTSTMEDFVEWFQTYVADFKGIAPDRLLVLGVQLYSSFQKSEFRRERREQRRAERAAGATASDGNAEPAEEEEAPKPAAPRRGRKPAAATAEDNGQPAKPARRGRKPVSAAY